MQIFKCIFVIVGISLMGGCACKQALNEAMNEKTAKAYSDFLEIHCKDGKCAKEAEIAKKQKEEAERLEEDACFEKAKKDNSIESYQSYLTQYPQGRYAKEAKRLRTRLWLKTEMPFDKGIEYLAQDMIALIKDISDPPPTVIYPFKISETGEEITDDVKIQSLLTGSLYKHLILIKMSSKGYEKAKFIIEGIITPEANPEISGQKDYHIYAILYEKDTGKIIAGGDTWVKAFDYEPKKVYKESPIYLKDKEDKKIPGRKPGDIVEEPLRKGLSEQAFIMDCDDLYERDQEQAAVCYEEQLQKGIEDMKVYAALYNIYYSSGNLEKAKTNFGNLVKLGFEKNGNIAFKLLFAVNSTRFITEELARKYALWLEEISRYLEQEKFCVKIIGHSSKTGNPGQLSRRRAETVQQIMAQTFPGIYNHSEAIGKGYEECISCTVPDGPQNDIDRRVEFKIVPCEELKQ